MSSSTLTKSNILSILLVTTLFYMGERTKSIGYISIVIILSIPILLFVLNFKRLRITKLFLIFFCYTAYGFLRLIMDFSLDSAQVYAKHITIIFGITTLSQLASTKIEMMRIAKFFSYFYRVILFLVLLSEFIYPVDLFSSILYKAVFVCLYFSIVHTNRINFYSILTVIALGITSKRSSILAVLAMLFIYKLLGEGNISKRKFRLLFIIVIGIVLCIPLAYMMSYHTELGHIINAYSRNIFDKNFFSGRQNIWEVLLANIKLKPILGYGFSNRILEYSNIIASAHNLYLNLIVQGGVILLVIFIIFMYIVYMNFYHLVRNRVNRLSAAYVLSILVRASFDLVLLENDLVLSIFMWIPIIFGLVYNNMINFQKCRLRN